MLARKTYTYKVVGGCRVRADLLGVSEERRPGLIWIHGGALIGGHRGNIRSDQARTYVEAGYKVISIDYRLAPETKLDAIMEDVLDAYGWVGRVGPDHLGIDPSRLAIVGHSAGGYLALLMGFRARPRPRAVVSFYGYGDIAGPWYSRPDPFYCRQPLVSKEDAFAAVGGEAISEARGPNERGRFYLYLRQKGLWPKEVVGRDPETEPGAFDSLCPVRNVDDRYPPTLLLHGGQDTDVPYEQSAAMAEELSRHGVENELITVPGGPHGFDGAGLGDPAVARAFARVLSFLRRWMVVG